MHSCVLRGLICGGESAARGVQGKALAKAKDLFWEADKDGNGVLSMGELRDMLREHSRKYSHFAEHARFLDGCCANAPALQSLDCWDPLTCMQCEAIC